MKNTPIVTMDELVVLLGLTVVLFLVSYLFVSVFHSNIERKTARLRGAIATVFLLQFMFSSIPFYFIVQKPLFLSLQKFGNLNMLTNIFNEVR